MAPGARDAEEDDLGHLLGGHHPFEDVRRPPVAVLEREIGRDAARADVRATHAVLAELVVEGARQPHLAELRRAVDGLARQSAPSRLGGDRDEVAFAARHEVRDGRTGRVDRAFEVDVDHLLEVVERVSTSVWYDPTPALATQMSSRPKRSTVCATACST